MAKPKSQREPEDLVDAEAAHREKVADIARDTMTGDIRDCILDFMKHDKNPLPWNMQGESSQRETIAKVEAAVRSAVEKVVMIIAADARPTIVCKLDKIAIKDDIQLRLILQKSDEQRHEILDAVGDVVLLVVSGADKFKGERSPAELSPDQHVLPSTGEDDDDGSVFDQTPSGRK